MTINRLAVGFFAAAFLVAPSALAQNEDAEDVRVRAERVIIEVDDEGRVLVDGKRLSDRDETVVLRVEPGDGEIEVEAVGPRRRHMVFRGDARQGHDRVRFRRGADGPHPHMEDFDFEMPHIPDVAPLLERFRFELGDPLRESMKEHREVAELERQSRDLARAARRAEGGERTRLEAELRTQLNEIFDKKVELREERIANLEEKVADEREKLQRRRAARAEMIESRLRMLMGEDDILDW